MTMGDRIKSLRKQYGLTLEELGQKLSPPVNFAAVNKWESGRVENIKRTHIQQMADLFGVTPSYLMCFDEMEIPIPKQAKLPVLGRVSAGTGVIAEEDVLGYESADARYDNGEYYYLRVTGDSMSPKIDDGDLVLVHRQTSVDSGSIGVFSVDGEDGFVKRVVYDKENIDLISFNPYYPPMHFQGPDVLRVYVLGKVVKMERSLL